MVASGIRVRAAAPGDLAAAELLFDSASGEFTMFAGSPARARHALAALWKLQGHSMSYERAWVAEVHGRLAGVAVGFPASARYRLHLRLLRRGAGYLPASRWFLLPPALGWLALAAPRPPRDAFYVAALAVSPRYFRRGVATALFDAMCRRAIENDYPKLAGHTGERHAPMRATAERYGFQAVRARSWGYVLYVMELDPRPASGHPASIEGPR